VSGGGKEGGGYRGRDTGGGREGVYKREGGRDRAGGGRDGGGREGYRGRERGIEGGGRERDRDMRHETERLDGCTDGSMICLCDRKHYYAHPDLQTVKWITCINTSYCFILFFLCLTYSF
jgi:hypothetical protein